LNPVKGITMNKKLQFAILFSFAALAASAQNQGILIDQINGPTPPARAGAAVMELRSTNQGVLIPKFSIPDYTSASPVPSPPVGTLVYNTCSSGANCLTGFVFWNGTNWQRFLSSVSQTSLGLTGSGSDGQLTVWGPSNTLEDVPFYSGLTIPTAGTFGVGAAPSGTYRLEVSGKVKSNGINETSDQRLKKNILGIDNALSKVVQMRGVTYDWKTEEFPEKNFSKGLQYGLIAQELEAIVPELVSTDNEGWKSVEYSHIVPLLIEAIKEQQKTIDRLQGNEERIATLEASIEKLLRKNIEAGGTSLLNGK
jgi:hypothetical protein